MLTNAHFSMREQTDQAEEPSTAKLLPVPRDWQGEACRQFDEEMELRMGGPYHKARELYCNITGARERIEDIHWDGRTPSEAEKKEENDLQSGIDEAESWLHENVWMNPVIKEKMFPIVRDRTITFKDDIVAFLYEMKAHPNPSCAELEGKIAMAKEQHDDIKIGDTAICVDAAAKARPSWLDGGLEALELARDDRHQIPDPHPYPLGYLVESNEEQAGQSVTDETQGKKW